MPDSNSETNPVSATPERSRVAEIVTGFALFGITMLSSVVLFKNWGDKEGEMVRYVFASIIPLLGSWMGTILAFYFSRDSLAAATQSVKDLTQAMTTQDKLKTTLVKDKMRRLSQIKFVEADDDTKTLNNLSALGVERIPVLSTKSVIRYLIYKALIDKYLATFAGGKLPAGKASISDLTLSDLIGSSQASKELFEGSFAFVPLDATLADAKREMEKIDKCADVFVTKNGKKDEPILGWITDNAIIENSKV